VAVKRKLGEPHGGAHAGRSTREPKSLTIRDFLALVDDGVRERLGREYGTFQTRQRFGYVQYWRGDHWLHYEVWVQRKTQRLEIGLHFEGDRERSYAASAMLADRVPDVVAAVGPEYELEEWTPSWTRLHRGFAAPALTPDLAVEAAEEAVHLIQGMEPLMVALGLRR
jgi:hypothetical protein